MLSVLLATAALVCAAARDLNLEPDKERGDPNGRVDEEEADTSIDAVYTLELTKENFEEVVLSNPDKTVLLMFYVPWCKYCRQLHPTFEAVAKELADRDDVIVARSDVEANPTRAKQYGVEIYPTIVRVDGPLDSDTRQSGTKFPPSGFRNVANLINFALGVSEEVETDPGSPIVPLTRKSWKQDVMNWLVDEPDAAAARLPRAQRGRRVLVAYFTKEGCSYCQDFATHIENSIVPAFRNEPHVRLAQVECGDERHGGGAELCRKLDIVAYPSFYLWLSEGGEVVRERLQYPSQLNALDVVVWINSHAGTRRAPGGGFLPKAYAFPLLSKALANLEEMSAGDLKKISPDIVSKLQGIADVLTEADHEDGEAAQVIATIVKLAVEGGTASSGETKTEPWGGSIVAHELDHAARVLSETSDVSKLDWGVTLQRRMADLRLHVLAPLRSVALLRGRQIRAYAESLGLEKARSATDVAEARAALQAALADSSVFDRSAFLDQAEEAEQEKAEELAKEVEARLKRARLTAGKSPSAQGIELLGTKSISFFRKRLLQNNNERFFVWFYIPKCMACEHMEEDFLKFAAWAKEENAAHAGDPEWKKLVVGKINNNRNREIVEWLGIYQAPTVLYFPAEASPDFDPEADLLSEDEKEESDERKLELLTSRLEKHVKVCTAPRTHDSFIECIQVHDRVVKEEVEDAKVDAAKKSAKASPPGDESEDDAAEISADSGSEGSDAKANEAAKGENDGEWGDQKDTSSGGSEAKVEDPAPPTANEEDGKGLIHGASIADIDGHADIGRCVFVRVCDSSYAACKAGASVLKWFADVHGGEVVRGTKAELVVVDVDVSQPSGSWAKVAVPNRWPQAFVVPKNANMALRVPFNHAFEKVALVDFVRSNCGQVTFTDE